MRIEPRFREDLLEEVEESEVRKVESGQGLYTGTTQGNLCRSSGNSR